jgi:hypothetical protein
MPDTRLLVPMQLDAMVLTDRSSVQTPFLRFQMNYNQLRGFRNPEPAPFAGGSTAPPDPGIYLHWTLPQALRHGVQQDGRTTFPWIPNRWLLARVQHGQPPAQAIKAWIIESDFAHPTDGSSPYINPAGLDRNGYAQPTLIGQARLLSAVTTLPSQPTPFLQAVGPGSVVFSAFEPGVGNVLAFYDAVNTNDDQTVIARATFTYYLAGWYSDAPHDPLAGTTWAANTDPKLPGTYVNSKLPWYVYATSATLPTQTLAHAMVSSVDWDRAGNTAIAPTYPKDIPNTVQVAVGTTGVEALAAVAGLHGGQRQADLLEAFQYGLIDQFDRPGSGEGLNAAIREHWYGASPGGTLWHVAPTEIDGNTALPTPPPPPLTADAAALLAALNVAQRELDRQQRILESMQQTLYGLWWMSQWTSHGGRPPVSEEMADWLRGQLPRQVGNGSTATSQAGTDPSHEPWYIWKVNAQQNLVNHLTAQRDAATAAVEARLDPSVGLKPTSLPRYFAPQDPVVLISGLGKATNLDPAEGIICRLPSQAVASLTVNGTAYSAASVAAQMPVLTAASGILPDGVQVLNCEAFFLSPGLFAQAALGNASQAPAVQTAIGGLPAPSASGQFPPIGYAATAWVQPWVPLLLDWQVTVLKGPAYSSPSGAPICTFNQANWQFVGTEHPEIDGADYQWVGPTQSGRAVFDEGDSLNMQLVGRTFVTPHLAFTLANQLGAYVRTHAPRDPAFEQRLVGLEGFVASVAGQDILSQRLSGLLGQMIQRRSQPTVAPTGQIAALLGNGQHGVPMPYPNQTSSSGPAPWAFAPLGGTFFVVNKLTVIDAFGRTIDLTLANSSDYIPVPNSSSEYSFYPIAGRGVQSPTGKSPLPYPGRSVDPTTRMLKLPPRAIQDSRLNFLWLSNDGADVDINLRAGANPICGWVVPNHLDRSLAIYGPDGAAWGELFLSRHVGNTFVPAWQPDPTNPNAPQTVDAIPNPFVRRMLQALWTRTDNGQALSDLLLAIDRSLWSINPPGDRNDLDLAVLVGRPLAIVRAELSLGLRGLPVTSQDWRNTFAVDSHNPPDDDGVNAVPLANLDGGVSSFTWPVRLGSRVLRDDGLIGYFADNAATPASTFDVFNVVSLPAELQTPYLAQVGQQTYPRLSFVDDRVTAPDPAKHQVCRLTMLVDPRGAVHAFSGLLPVTALQIPSTFVSEALNRIAYVFRAGPLLTTPEAVRVPRPAERRGEWTWFDKVLGAATAITPADGKATIATTPPLVKEGWLKLTPDTTPPTTPGPARPPQT